MRVCLVSRPEPGMTGTARYTASLVQGLGAHGVEVVSVSTQPTGLAGRVLSASRMVGLDAGAFLASYPIALPWPEADVYHLTVQTYATVLPFARPPGPVLVTVHDLIPYLVRHDRRLNVYNHPLDRALDWLSLRGLTRARLVVADSQWTKRTVMRAAGLGEERVEVVPLGVDAARFRPRDVPAAFRERYALEPDRRYVLYVGSEDPRKNLDCLLRAFALLHHDGGAADVRLLKVGTPHHLAEHRRLQALASELGLSGFVHWIEQVPESDLPLFYNVAEVFVMPSLYEGFGLPVLEAMASGTPVICADATALPEVAGADCVLVPPTAPDLARSIRQALAENRKGHRRAARRSWAQRFSWTDTIAGITRLYRSLCEPSPGAPVGPLPDAPALGHPPGK